MTTQFAKTIFNALLLLSGILFVQPQIQLPQEMIVPVMNLKAVDMKQLHCMATNIYYEAGRESIKGQAAVARVVMNRIQHGFAKSVCAVVYQKTVIEDKIICQFSWVCEGKEGPNKNSYRYAVAKQVAYDVMVNGMYKDVVPKSTLFFHAITINPLWPYKQVAIIGNHVFYSKAKKIHPDKS
jgi:spore germination cell wall hydrolase CwlJ-like protein